MILVRESMKQAILRRDKYVTRRQGRKRWNVGAKHLLYTRPAFARPPGRPFARVQIVSVIAEDWPGTRWGITASNLDDEGRREGFRSWSEFRAAYAEINDARSAVTPGQPHPLYAPCWRVEWDPDTLEVLEAAGEEADGE